MLTRKNSVFTGLARPRRSGRVTTCGCPRRAERSRRGGRGPAFADFRGCSAAHRGVRGPRCRGEGTYSLVGRCEAANRFPGHLKGANEILRTLRPKIEGTQVSTGLRFRLEALTGSFWLATRQPGPAETHLSLAVSLDPENARARANLSTARAMIGLSEDALEDARNAIALAASDGYVASVFVRRLAESGCTSELEDFVRAKQDDDLSDPYLLGAIADALCDAGRTKDVVLHRCHPGLSRNSHTPQPGDALGPRTSYRGPERSTGRACAPVANARFAAANA